MRYLLACVTRDGHRLKELQDEILVHPDCHLVAEFYEAPYPETMRTSELTLPAPTVNMLETVAVAVELRLSSLVLWPQMGLLYQSIRKKRIWSISGMITARGKLKCPGENLPQYQFVHHISCTDYSGLNPGLCCMKQWF
jgi:hypothetical protein